MTSDRSLEKRVTGLENDVTTIYDLLTDLKTTQDGHTAILAEHSRRFDRIDTTLAEVLRRLPEPS